MSEGSSTMGYGAHNRSYDSYYAKDLTIADDAKSDALAAGGTQGMLTINIAASATVSIAASATLGVGIVESDTLDGTYVEPDNSVIATLKASSSARTFAAGDEIISLVLPNSKNYAKAVLLIEGTISGKVDIYQGYLPR